MGRSIFYGNKYVRYGDGKLIDVVVGPTQSKEHIRQVHDSAHLRILIPNLRQHLASQTCHKAVHVPPRNHQITMNLIIVPAPHHSDLHEKGVIVDVIEVDLNLSGFDGLAVPCIKRCIG